MILFKQKCREYAAKALGWLLQKKVGYLAGQPERFVLKQGLWCVESAPASELSKPVMIVARHCYQEFVKTYPIASLKELKSVLVQEYAGKPLVRHVIAAADGNQRKVCTYVFSAATAVALQKSWLILPESMLLWVGQPEAAIFQINSTQPFFLSSVTDLPVSQRLNPLMHSVERFALSQGLPTETPTRLLAQNELPAALAAGFQRVLFQPLLHNFWQTPQARWSATQLRLVTAGVVSAALLYMLGSSLYLQLAVSRHEHAIAALGSEVNALLDTQSDYEKQVEDFARYQTVHDKKQYTAHLWLVLAELAQKDPALEFNSINSEDNALVVRGKTNRATELLALLQAHPMVRRSEFSAPVLREGDKESFVITLELVQQPVSRERSADAK